MDAPDAPDPADETVFLYDLSPELEEALLRRARENGRDPAHEVTDIIEKHVKEEDPDPLK
jgi:predicted DNA-binding protein